MGLSERVFVHVCLDLFMRKYTCVLLMFTVYADYHNYYGPKPHVSVIILLFASLPSKRALTKRFVTGKTKRSNV